MSAHLGSSLLRYDIYITVAHSSFHLVVALNPIQKTCLKPASLPLGLRAHFVILL
jgi:hypothetical protein